MECSSCKKKAQKPLKRCKHFELGGDKKRKVHYSTFDFILINAFFLSGTNDPVLSIIIYSIIIIVDNNYEI